MIALIGDKRNRAYSGYHATATYNYYYSDYRNAAADPQGTVSLIIMTIICEKLPRKIPWEIKTTKTYDGQNHVITVTDRKPT